MDKITTTQSCELQLKQSAKPEAQAAGNVQTAVNGRMALDSLPLAMAYVPMQMWNTTYDASKGLERGTIFPELDLPFCGKGAR